MYEQHHEKSTGEELASKVCAMFQDSGGSSEGKDSTFESGREVSADEAAQKSRGCRSKVLGSPETQ
ncbi:hypothetical protein N7462_010578 [Penicillium macrosclerotiorum]|uniref:uncharacterized protein n=1 Tax=Penicillium macrosclerotiorum TaxID=303699 RepID=UPI002546DDE3|nr:uncharacterized protein N7462_010578 [Penicillium macrosclerotiorum]KAJ5669508.1 hypothetical protein N7462_010578 [Penicillium macrosclerotiorum]